MPQAETYAAPAMMARCRQLLRDAFTAHPLEAVRSAGRKLSHYTAARDGTINLVRGPATAVRAVAGDVTRLAGRAA